MRLTTIGLPRAALLALLLALPACEGGSGPPEPRPGELTLRVDVPSSSTPDRALVVSVAGPTVPTSVVAADARYTVHWRPEGQGFRAAVFGSVQDGAVLRFSVPDVGQAAAYQASVVEAADGSNQLRASLVGYAATVER